MRCWPWRSISPRESTLLAPEKALLASNYASKPFSPHRASLHLLLRMCKSHSTRPFPLVPLNCDRAYFTKKGDGATRHTALVYQMGFKSKTRTRILSTVVYVGRCSAVYSTRLVRKPAVLNDLSNVASSASCFGALDALACLCSACWLVKLLRRDTLRDVLRDVLRELAADDAMNDGATSSADRNATEARGETGLEKFIVVVVVLLLLLLLLLVLVLLLLGRNMVSCVSGCVSGCGLRCAGYGLRRGCCCSCLAGAILLYFRVPSTSWQAAAHFRFPAPPFC
ncbi:hypothetical protein GQ42DRAFT_71244 [Ramicandelaber brevisporus]|nr:hypothetical protein GQ42DRAFT_71244 [Ramicandelaber brevisporus]